MAIRGRLGGVARIDRAAACSATYLESRVVADHPLRLFRGIVNEVVVSPSAEFEGLYSPTGRPGIAPEKLLRALLLRAFYSRSAGSVS